MLDQALLSSDLEIARTIRFRPPAAVTVAAVTRALAGVQVSVHEAIICPEFQRIFEFEKFNQMQSTCLNSVSTFIDPPSMN